MIKWLKKLRRIVKDYDKDRTILRVRIEEAEDMIRARTQIHADIHMKSPNQIIVVGRYHNRDYVQVFSLSTDDLVGLIEHFRHLEKYGHMARIDAPLSLKAAFEPDYARGAVGG